MFVHCPLQSAYFTSTQCVADVNKAQVEYHQATQQWEVIQCAGENVSNESEVCEHCDALAFKAENG
jgi:hypothetical protein